MILCELMEVDHLVSLKDAWESGVCGDKLKRLANDPRNLRFTHWETNRKKGRLSPEKFVKMLPDKIAVKVLLDADVIRDEYGVFSRNEILIRKLKAIKHLPEKHITIQKNQVPAKALSKLSYEKAGSKFAIKSGKRLIGYAVGVGVTVEVIQISWWALGSLSEVSESKLQRQTQFRYLLGLPVKK